MINEEKLKIQKEALQALRENNFRGVVILPTGTGKTYVLIEALKELYKPGMRVLYSCDSTELRDVDFNKELSKWGADDYKNLIEKKCYAGAYEKKGEHYDILLADEGDYALTPEYSKLFFNNTFTHIIFVSATLEAKKAKIAKQIAPIVYRKKIKEIEDQRVINKCQFYIVPYLLNEKENRQYLAMNKRFHSLLQAEKTHSVEESLKFLQIQRQHFLAKLESSVYICRRLMQEIYNKDPKSKTLIFCSLNEEADKVCKYSYHSKNAELNNLEKFDNGEFGALAVCGKVNRGKNIKGVNFIIIKDPKKSETLMVQRIGRGRRLKENEFLSAYLLVPYYKTAYSLVKPTIVLDWVNDAAREMGIENAKTHIIN